MATSSIRMEQGWKKRLASEFTKPYMGELKSFLQSEIKNGKTIFPEGGAYFAALNATPLESLKVVILGQDPYHGDGQAHGLCFSVRPGITPPPSLVNIFKELERDLGIPKPSHGCLEAWAEQGVLLLNSVLTVTKGEAASHQKRGWETFTDQVIDVINRECSGVAFLLWGAYAQKKCAFIDRDKHLVLEAAHPSPLSAHRGFLGCGHFSKVNHYLKAQGKEPIDWSLPELH